MVKIKYDLNLNSDPYSDFQTRQPVDDASTGVAYDVDGNASNHRPEQFMSSDIKNNISHLCFDFQMHTEQINFATKITKYDRNFLRFDSKSYSDITHDHLRAARALLGWSMTELSKMSGLSISTIKRVEQASHGVNIRSYQHVINALRVAGIRFVKLSDGTTALAKDQLA